MLNLVNQLPAETREAWENLVSGELAETNERNKIDQTKPYLHVRTVTSSEEEDSDFGEFRFQTGALQEVRAV